MVIKKIKEGNWRVEESFGYTNGKQNKIRKQGFRTRKEAKEWIEEQVENRRAESRGEASIYILFKDYILKWFYDFKFSFLSVEDRDNYLNKIYNYIIPKIGDYKLKQLMNNDIIQRFYNSLAEQSLNPSEKGLNPSNVKEVMGILDQVFGYAMKSNLIFRIPLDIERKPELEVWTKAELEYFLQRIARTELFIAVYIESFTGAKAEELCGLKWSDIDLEKGTISIKREAITYENKVYLTDRLLKAERKERTITIPQILVDYLKQTKVNRNAEETDFIILVSKITMSSSGRFLTNLDPQNPCSSNELDKIFATIIENMKERNKGIKLRNIGFEGLRHTYISILVRSGKNIKDIGERLGDENLETVLKHVLIQQLDKEREG